MKDRGIDLASQPADATLVIEASTSAGSLAIVRDGKVAAQNAVAMGVSRDDGLFPAIQALLMDSDLEPSAIARVVCGAGPGSFTSLRIAASLAKGLAHGSGATLSAVSSLALSAAVAVDILPDTVTDIVVHADALRGERYVQRMRVDGARMVDAGGPVERVAFVDLDGYSRGALRVAVGSSPDPALEGTVVLPSAAAIVRIRGWHDLSAVSLETWEPAYGRLAEAQVVWERTHGHALPSV
ncbi:MAG: tRNA (adenosine(37)-N6)-threonylcarbamoyltransferase complex dimerization subunit type 1 TsaB [Gemmatimonadota bacterium]